MDKYLVEIQSRDWFACAGQPLAYEEVEADSEYSARIRGYDQFITKWMHQPHLKKEMAVKGLTDRHDFCAPGAVCLTERKAS